MSYLIDGYNLLNATGIVGRGVGPGTLERSRLAMLNFLAESLPPEEISRTTVVFDAWEAPRGLPRVTTHRGITVRFASPHGDADVMIEELIRSDSAPRRLTVVSSDHRLQRAARRRKAAAVDSDVWYAQIVRQRQQRQQSASETSARPPVPLLQEDVNYWIRQFGGESALMGFIEQELDQLTDKPPPPEEPPDAEPAPDKPDPEQAIEFDNPFPPGYGEDLLEDDDLI